MVSILWTFLIVIAIIYSFISGKIDIINNTILTSGNDAFELLLSLLPTIALWSGIMKIAEESGLLTKFANLLSPFLSKLFPSVPKDNKSIGYI